MASADDGGPRALEKKNADQGVPGSGFEVVTLKTPFAASMEETTMHPAEVVATVARSVMLEWTVTLPPCRFIVDGGQGRLGVEGEGESKGHGAKLSTTAGQHLI